MEKKNTLLLIAAIGTTVLTVFDHFYYLGILEGDFFADFCTYTNIASNLLFGWFFLMLYSRSAKRSVLKDASIMGMVAAIFWIVSYITINYIIYHSMSSDDPIPYSLVKNSCHSGTSSLQLQETPFLSSPR